MKPSLAKTWHGFGRLNWNFPNARVILPAHHNRLCSCGFDVRAVTAAVSYPQFNSRATRPHGEQDEDRSVDFVSPALTAEQIRAGHVDHQIWAAAKSKLAILFASMSILLTPPAQRRSRPHCGAAAPTAQKSAPNGSNTHHEATVSRTNTSCWVALCWLHTNAPQ